MTTLLLTVFVASLLGSLHCAGMCGPFVAFVMGGADDAGGGLGWRVASAYHVGRLMTYTLLGALVGSLGAALDLGGAMVGVSHSAAALAGVMMIVGGGVALLRASGWRVGARPAGAPPGPWRRALMAGQRGAMRLTPVRRAWLIGTLSTLLPCGWLWAFAAAAAGTAHPLWGAAVMAAFWAGTVPIMLGLGVGLRSLTAALGSRLPVITAVAVVVIGLVTIGVRLNAAPSMLDPLSTPAQAATNDSPGVINVPTEAPCH